MLRRVLITGAVAAVIVVRVVGQASAAPQQTQQDSPRTSPGGATFMLPAGWTSATKASLVILDPPEPDTHVVIADVKGADAQAAVTAAWAAGSSVRRQTRSRGDAEGRRGAAKGSYREESRATGDSR